MNVEELIDKLKKLNLEGHQDEVVVQGSGAVRDVEVFNQAIGSTRVQVVIVAG